MYNRHRHSRPATRGPKRHLAPNRPSEDRPAPRALQPEPNRNQPRFLTAAHADPFWRKQAQILNAAWRAAPAAPSIGITWDRGQVTGDATWRDILPGFSEPIPCDPEHPDAALLRRLGEGLVALHRTCADYRLDHFTTARITETFLASVLFESEIKA